MRCSADATSGRRRNRWLQRRRHATKGLSPSPPGARLDLRAARTEEKTKTEPATRTQRARPWSVVVHDDPVTPMTYVTKVLMDVFGYAEGKAQRLMLEVHHTGRAIVWTGPRESAELHVQKLQSRHLLATLEPGSEDAT